jgi:uncharacterized membrane protein YdbT with pleckstrin-like domain
MGYIERKRILFFGLPWTFTLYTIEDDVINIKEGFFKTVENDCYMYKVQDVQLERTMAERLFGLGTIICYTGDSTHQRLCISHIKNAKAIKNYILEASEAARMKRRTLNTLNIGSTPIDEVDMDS